MKVYTYNEINLCYKADCKNMKNGFVELSSIWCKKYGGDSSFKNFFQRKHFFFFWYSKMFCSICFLGFQFLWDYSSFVFSGSKTFDGLFGISKRRILFFTLCNSLVYIRTYLMYNRKIYSTPGYNFISILSKCETWTKNNATGIDHESFSDRILIRIFIPPTTIKLNRA